MYIITPNKVGAQRPIKIPRSLSPEKNKYSATTIIAIHKVSIMKLETPNFLINFMLVLFPIKII